MLGQQVQAADVEYTDTKDLRKNVFISHNDSELRLFESNFRRGRWNTKLNYTHINDTEVFPSNGRALKCADILENIAVHLTREDLLNCRLVCKMWSIEMGRSLVKRKHLIVTDPHCPNADTIIKKRLRGNPVTLARLCLFDINAGCVMYKKLFSLFGNTLASVCMEECELTPEELKHLLIDYAPNICNFHLREEETKARQKVSTIIQIRSKNDGQLLLPNLKYLHWNEGNGRTDLKDLIETFPNLIKLELRRCPSPRPAPFKKLTWGSLRELFLSPTQSLTKEHCLALTHLNLNLKKLILFSVNPTDHEMTKAMTKFLTTQSETLEVLELWLDYVAVLEEVRVPMHSPFPVVLPHLKRLHTESEIMGHINHVNQLSSLIDLEVVSNPNDNNRSSWVSLTHKASLLEQSNLRTFRCGDVDMKSLNKVIKAFPNIVKLHMYSTYVDDTFLRSVITNLPNLEDLTISPYRLETDTIKITDAGVTGLPINLCTKFKNGDPAEMLKMENMDINGMKTEPGIADLKCLHTLDLGHQISEISDVSVILSISNIKTLGTLRLPSCKISDVSLEVIGDRLGTLLFFGVAGCKGITKDGLSNLKERRKRLIIDNDLGIMKEF